MTSLIVKSAMIVLLLAGFVVGQEPATELNLRPYRLDFVGSGARAEGMGNAYIGVSDDVSAGSWNPAGLSSLESPIISLAWGTMKPRGTSNTTVTIDQGTFAHTGSINGVSAINFAAPVRIKGHQFVGAFNFTRHSDEFVFFGQSAELWVPYYVPIGDNRYRKDSIFFESHSENELSGGLESVSFSFGTRVYNNLSAGVSLNIYTGTMVEDNPVIRLADTVVDFTNLQIYEMSINSRTLDSTSFSGFNFTLGAKYSGDKFDIGAIIRTPFSLNTTIDRSIYQIRAINGLPTDEGTDTLYFDDNLAKYDIPWIIAVGGAFRPNEKLTLATDVELRSFGSSKINFRTDLLLDPGGENTEFFEESDPEWKSVIHIRMGGEYMMESAIGQIPLRAGYGYVPLILPSRSIDGAKSTTVRTTMSVGTGIWWEQIHLDAAYTYSTFDYDEFGNLNFKNRDHHLNLMFTGYF